MSFITESKLKSYRKSVQLSYKTLNESLREFKAESKFLKTKIFLSHKHDELEKLEGGISFLKKHGVNVYVDWLDDGMPKTTSGITAVRIKEKIKENKKFILLATEKAINSKWCNWELGLGDAAKYIDHIALLVVKDDYGNWTGNEYLQIYPVIGRKYSWTDQYYEVQFPNGNKIDLEDWLKKKYGKEAETFGFSAINYHKNECEFILIKRLVSYISFSTLCICCKRYQHPLRTYNLHFNTTVLVSRWLLS